MALETKDVFLNRRETEEKAKGVVVVWGTEFVQFIAALYLFCTRMI